MTPQKRRMHLIDKHMYPKNFFFAVTLHGIDGRQSMLLDERRKPGNRPPTTETKTCSSKPTPTSKSKPPSDMKGDQMEVDQPKPTPSTQPDVEMTDKQHEESVQEDAIQEPADVDMGDLVGKMSALQFVPSSIRFGRGGRKTGFARG